MLMARQVRVLTVKERYELAGNLQSQILAFAFGLAAQIERDLISQRTKEGLARIRAEGTRLGRRPGGHNTRYKLTGCEDSIRRMRDEGNERGRDVPTAEVQPQDTGTARGTD